MVNESAAFTATVDKEFAPSPLNVSVLAFDPVSVPERVVTKVLPVVIEELLETVTAPEVVTLPVA
jgi:hypothetical protein